MLVIGSLDSSHSLELALPLRSVSRSKLRGLLQSTTGRALRLDSRCPARPNQRPTASRSPSSAESSPVPSAPTLTTLPRRNHSPTSHLFAPFHRLITRLQLSSRPRPSLAPPKGKSKRPQDRSWHSYTGRTAYHAGGRLCALITTGSIPPGRAERRVRVKGKEQEGGWDCWCTGWR
jgi:hypothetical protein